MIAQESSAKIKIIPFFILSVCIHLFVLFAIFYNGHEKEQFIQIPIDVDFISPVETNNSINKAPSEPKKAEEAPKPVVKEKNDTNSIKIEKKTKKKKEEKKYKPKEKSQKEIKKETPVKTEQTETFSDDKVSNNIDPFNIPSNSGDKGVMFDNKNFKFSYYTSSIIKKMRRNWHWSGSYRALRAVVYFKINRDGDVITSKIKESSGNDEFDENALRAVQLSSPFAPLPEAYSEKDLGVYFEFKFN